MGWFNHDEGAQAHADIYGHTGEVEEHHKGKFFHEAIAGAAGFEAMKAYEDHLRKEGKPVHHSKMKELLAGFAAAEIDKLAESKGLDWVDKEKAKRDASHQAVVYAEQRYGDDNTGFEYAQRGQQNY